MRREGTESLREEKTPIVFIGLGGWCFARIMNRLFEVRYILGSFQLRMRCFTTHQDLDRYEIDSTPDFSDFQKILDYSIKVDVCCGQCNQIPLKTTGLKGYLTII
jgi:hypothetical protein